MTLKSTVNAAIPSALAIVSVALLVRYFGNQPFVMDIKEGMQGNVKP